MGRNAPVIYQTLTIEFQNGSGAVVPDEPGFITGWYVSGR